MITLMMVKILVKRYIRKTRENLISVCREKKKELAQKLNFCSETSEQRKKRISSSAININEESAGPTHTLQCALI